MDKNKQKHGTDAETLTYSEQTVLDAVSRHKAPLDDLSEIAKVCRLSEMQVGVAVQLLTHKKLIPPH